MSRSELERARCATFQVVSVALPMGFQQMLGRAAKYLPAGLHGSDGSAISSSFFSLPSSRSAVTWAAWSKKWPMSNTLALLNLLDAHWGCDPAFVIIWNRFRHVRRYLAYRPDEEGRMFRFLDCAATGSPGRGPVHLLFPSAAEIVFPRTLQRLVGFALAFSLCA